MGELPFKAGSIPTLFAGFKALKPRCRDNSARREDNGVIQNFTWVNDLDYSGYHLTVLECVEENRKTGAKTRFVWVTDMEVNQQNYRSIAQGGR